MDIKYLNKQLFILPSLLSVWLVLSCSLLGWLDPKSFLIAIIFLIISTILCLTYSLRYAGWAVAGMGAVFYFGVHFPVNGITGNEIRIVTTGVVSLIGAAILGTFTAEQLFQVFTQIKYNRKMIEELRIVDPVSGLIRFHYARRNLNTEIARCQRYNKYLCLIVARIANWNELVEEKGQEGSQQIMSQVGDIFRRSIRNVDLAYINIEKLGVILPETKLEGAIQVAQRIIETCSKKNRVALNIGIASFPGDAINDTEIIRTAESALQISMSSGQPIVFYSQIQSAIDDNTQEKLKLTSSVYSQDENEENLTEEMILQVKPAGNNAILPIVDESNIEAVISENVVVTNLDNELEFKDEAEIISENIPLEKTKSLSEMDSLFVNDGEEIVKNTETLDEAVNEEAEIQSQELTEAIENGLQPEEIEEKLIIVNEEDERPISISDNDRLFFNDEKSLMSEQEEIVSDVVNNKDDWVMPYHAPITNLHLETLEEDYEFAEEATPPEEEILLGIQKVEQLSELPEIEKALYALPVISTVRMVDFSDQTLVLNVKHFSQDIVESLRAGLNLPLEEVRGGDQWIEIILKKSE